MLLIPKKTLWKTPLMTKSWNTLRKAPTLQRKMNKKNSKQELMRTINHTNLAVKFQKQSQAMKTLKSIISSIMMTKTRSITTKKIKAKWLKSHLIIIKINLLLHTTSLPTQTNLLKSRIEILTTHLKSLTDLKWLIQKHFRKTLRWKLWRRKLHSCKSHC